MEIVRVVTILDIDEERMRATVTGATGLVGRQLIEQLDNVVVLTRDSVPTARLFPSAVAHQWDFEAGPPPTAALDGAEAIFHLAGEPIAQGRWTEDKKRRIRDSRIIGTRNLVAGLAVMKSRPLVLISASAVGYYGDRADEVLEETSSAGHGFLANLCSQWEQEAMEAERLDIRVVCVRIGIVLASGGGALSRMLMPFRFGAGGRLGSGKQWMSWVHIDDVVGIFVHASRNDQIRGAINAVGPKPVTNAEFSSELGRALHRPTFLAVPQAALRLAFGEMSEVLTASQRVRPRVAERTGYRFKYPELGGALDAVLTPTVHGEAA
jgi:uncharacterized protein (TIGR01777 family)